jgi:hypothetical protein
MARAPDPRRLPRPGPSPPLNPGTPIIGLLGNSEQRLAGGLQLVMPVMSRSSSMDRHAPWRYARRWRDRRLPACLRPPSWSDPAAERRPGAFVLQEPALVVRGDGTERLATRRLLRWNCLAGIRIHRLPPAVGLRASVVHVSSWVLRIGFHDPDIGYIGSEAVATTTIELKTGAVRGKGPVAPSGRGMTSPTGVTMKSGA